MSGGFLYSCFIFLAAACLVVPLANRFKLGSVLGYLAAGIIIGPFGTRLIGNSDAIMHFAEFGVVMMLFLIGLELEPAKLWKLRKSIIGLGGMQVMLTSAAFTVSGIMLGFDWQMSLACGMALSLSSTALVLQMLEEKELLHTDAGEASFSVLLFQDIAVIPILIIMPLLASPALHAPKDISLLSHLPGWAHALVIAAIIAAIVIAGRYGSRYLFRYIARTNLREVFTAVSLALVVGIALLMQTIQLSPALGAFIAGVVLANSEYKHTLESDIAPFKGLLLGLFFISVGMGMDFALMAQHPAALISAVVALIIVKMMILIASGRLFRLEAAQNMVFAFALAQGGEFAFVLFQYAGGLQVLSTEHTAFLTLVVALSMAATPFLMIVADRLVIPRFMSLLPERPADRIDANDHPVIIAGYGRFGQVIGRFLSAQGIKLTILEKDPDQIELLRRFGSKAYFGDATRLELLKSAGAATATILIVAIDDADKALEIVRNAKSQFPGLTIFARARNRRHAYELQKAGADLFRRETFDASLWMAQEAMKLLGKRAFDVRHKAMKFMKHDEETLKTSFSFFEHEPELINFAKQARLELERILNEDIHTDEHKISRNEGWGN
jgi:monovalent cation:proton antiporter-2 (CPA2) family protein